MPKDEGKHAQPPTLRAFPYQLETLHWRPDHLENEEGVYCYCGKGKAAKGKTTETEPMLSCSSCRQLFHSDCVACLPRKLLEGDAFYTFTCSVCGNGTQRYERSTMSWMVVTQLVLYTLYQRHPDKEFFRWREDICLFIDEYWQYLKPGAPRSPTWHNTVASVLSTAQNKVFRSGTATLGPGWWALKVIEPPQPGVTKGGPKSKKSAVQPTKKQIVPQLRRRASSASSFGDAPSASKSATPARTKVKQKPVPKRKLVEDSPRAPTPKKAKSESKTEPKTEGMQGKSAKAPRKHLGKAPTLVKETTPSLLADIFGDSDSDLSSHDSYLSSTEGSPAKGAGKQPRKGGKHPWASKATKGPGLRKFAQKGQKRSVSESSSSIFSSSEDEIPQTSRTLPGSVAVPQIEADSSSSSSDASGIFSDNASDGFEEEREESDEESSENDLPTIPVNDEEPQRVIAVVPRKPAKVEAKTSAPAHHMLMTLEQEHALLQRLSATTHLPAPLARLRRKIHLRRLKRSVGVRLFDLDAVVSRTLRDHPSRTLTPLVHRSDGLPSLVTLPDGRVSRLVVRGMDPRSALVRFRAVVPVTTTPYANSFLSRLQGNVQPRVVTSPYTGKPLLPYIWHTSDVQTLAQRTLLTISKGVGQSLTYSHLTRGLLGPVNDLLSNVFWPAIDVSEAMEYPDFTIVACYGALVVGVAIMTPEAYLSYLAVRSGWGGSGIARFMLFHLIRTASGKDITLHVSANNKAMLLYQRLGFKPEEFIVGFYHKYLPAESTACKNALFVRLRK